MLLGIGARNGADDGAFGPDVYSNIRVGCQRSAAVVAPAVQEIVRAESVIDVGGGEGWWASAFAELGARAVSVDVGSLEQPAAAVQQVHHDLRHGVPAGLGVFDLALCLEVAEHLDQPAGDRLVSDLCRVATVVLFSAAVPGQDARGQLNEQWPDYWVERFSSFGFHSSGALRWRFWRDERVEYWYRQNLLFCTREPSRFPELFDTPLAEPWAVVHPGTLARWRAKHAATS
jgi:hypothetical protein